MSINHKEKRQQPAEKGKSAMGVNIQFTGEKKYSWAQQTFGRSSISRIHPAWWGVGGFYYSCSIWKVEKAKNIFLEPYTLA